MNSKNTESFMTIADLWNLCIARWRWFVASVLVAILLAFFYLCKTPFIYSRQAAILVCEESLGNNSTEQNGGVFNNLGFVNQNSNVTNVVRHITSLSVLLEVVNHLYPTLKGGDALNKALGIQSRLSVTNNDFKSTIIDLTYRDYSTAEAELVLSSIIQSYDELWLENKRKMIRSTSRFIDERLALLRNELEIVDDSIAVFKSNYGITDLANVSNIYLGQQRESDAAIMKLTSQKEMAEFIRELLEDEISPRQLLLVNSGINDSGIEAQITLYNNLLLELQNHLKYTSEQNPVIVHQLEEINSLRSKILTNLLNYIHALDIQLESLVDYYNEATVKVTSNPSQAKYLATIERERKVKESLYMFLLQKKEENEISVTYQATNIQILDAPHGGGKPTSPKRAQVILAAILLGFLIPVTVIFLRASFDDSVRDRYDIERNSDIPFLGEIPYSGREHSLESLLMPFGFGRKTKSSGIVVEPDMLNASNEAFRVLRNNMDSIQVGMSLDNGGKIYLIKSTQIEVGRTFIGMNLALIKAIGGQRVLFIDGDLRQASASRLWRTPQLGLTNYLYGEESDYRKLLWHPEDYPMLDILPAGALPTNPTELLQSPLFSQLLDTIRSDYDSVIIDSPAAGVLADADIIEHFVDCILFIIRAGRFNRNQLNEISHNQAINSDSKLQYIILNGVSIDARYGYTYLHKYERSDKNTVALNK
jgi:capsular exopolysaccharide synthesis family protein